MSNDEIEDAIGRRTHSLDAMVMARRFGPEYQQLRDELLYLERLLANKRGQEHAVELLLGDVWNGQAYSPNVVGGAFDCVITYATAHRQYAAISFRMIAGYKLTDVSDEILEGHHLKGKGLAAYKVFEVKNSSWIQELEAVDRIHPQHSNERWRTSIHYLLCFKDRMFEAVSSRMDVIGKFPSSNEALAAALALLRLDEALVSADSVQSEHQSSKL